MAPPKRHPFFNPVAVEIYRCAESRNFRVAPLSLCSLFCRMTSGKIAIPVTGAFSPKECLWFLNRGFDDCMYRVYPNSIRKAFSINGKVLLTEIVFSEEGLELTWLAGACSAEALEYIRQWVTTWFDLESNLTVFYTLLRQEDTLAYMTDRYAGLRFIGIPDLFEALAWGIIGQQINLRFAYALKRRLVERYGTFINYGQEPYYIFPGPEVIAAADPMDLRDMQLSHKKAAYLIRIAEAFTHKTLSKEQLRALPDFPSRQAYLMAHKGIGLWTANYILMKCMGERSCIPCGDAGLSNALMGHKIMKDKKDLPAMETLFQKFKGWESYLVFYLWRSLSPMPEETK